MSKALYPHFERHAHGEGLKGKTTHYCPGCGHGNIHNFMAQAIDELEIQDQTVTISPVGCSVFLYYYMDTGNTQAAHGRAPAVGLGHKLANPESIVISYQGDGDLASIGLSEIMFAAQLGVPLTVIFVNNAIYGMTGGQMAPTTLMGQRSTTSPTGRGLAQGEPMKVAELMAQLDGPVYVERVALYDNKQRKRAAKAIKKALLLQKENRGFAFVEVLAECPTHLKTTPTQAEQWVKNEMTKIYPLGVLKDNAPDQPREALGWPDYTAAGLLRTVGAQARMPERFAEAFPTHLDASDISLKLAGSGGDGAQTAAMLIATAAINEGFDATHIPSYGPESRGGTSYADVHVASEEVLSPASPAPHSLLAFNAPSLQKFGRTVVPGGTIVYDSNVVTELPDDLAEGVRLFPVPCSEIAIELGAPVVKNTVALGALLAATNLLPEASLLGAVKAALGSKRGHLVALNEKALQRGGDVVRAQLSGTNGTT